jgi:hypothetical protein
VLTDAKPDFAAGCFLPPLKFGKFCRIEGSCWRPCRVLYIVRSSACWPRRRLAGMRDINTHSILRSTKTARNKKIETYDDVEVMEAGWVMREALTDGAAAVKEEEEEEEATSNMLAKGCSSYPLHFLLYKNPVEN